MNKENMDDIFSRIKNGSREDNKKLAEELRNGLSDEQSKALDSILSDRSLMGKIMESDEAKNILKMFGGDDGGHK